MSYFSYDELDLFIFNGKEFYEMYKNAHFLENKSNIRKILHQQAELDFFINTTIKPGEYYTITQMYLTSNNAPLKVMRSRRIDERDVHNSLFTPRRLRGLTAAYVLANDSKFPDIIASEAEDLGLDWKKEGHYPAKIYHLIYLSAVSGAEYFVDHFGFYPLVCALKKYHLRQITAEMLIDVTKIRSRTGERVSTRSIYPQNGPRINFLGTFDLTKAIDSAPEEVKWIFKLGDSSEGKKK